MWLWSLNYNGKFTLFSQFNTYRACKSVMTVNQLAGGAPKCPNKFDFPPFKHYQSSVLLSSLSGRQDSSYSSSTWCKPVYRGWESTPLLDLCSGLCKCNQAEKRPLPCCSLPAKTSLSARCMTQATAHDCRPASATLNFVKHCFWQTQRRMSERARTLTASVACVPLFIIRLSMVGWYSISMRKYPHITYLTDRMERRCTNRLARCSWASWWGQASDSGLLQLHAALRGSSSEESGNKRGTSDLIQLSSAECES